MKLDRDIYCANLSFVSGNPRTYARPLARAHAHAHAHANAHAHAHAQVITDKGIVVRDRVSERPLAVLTETKWEEYQENVKYIETGLLSLRRPFLPLRFPPSHSLCPPHTFP
jgi:hypothetical protein